MDTQRYQLRKAAGGFYLLDLGQDGKCYRKPLCLNESGAEIYELLSGEGTVEGAAHKMAERYGMESKDLLPDIIQFAEMLKKQGFLTGME